MNIDIHSRNEIEGNTLALQDAANEPIVQNDEPLQISLSDTWPIFMSAKYAGVDIDKLISDTGLTSECFEKQEGYIPLADYFRFLRELSFLSFDETCKMSQRPMTIGTNQFMLDQLSECKTLRDVLLKVAELSNVLNGGTYIHVREEGEHIKLVFDDATFPYKINIDQVVFCLMECILILLSCLCCYLTNHPTNHIATRVSVKRGRDSKARHLNFFSDHIQYGCDYYSLTFEQSRVNQSIVIPNGRLDSAEVFANTIRRVHAHRRYDDTETLSEKVKRLIRSDLLSQSQVADKLGMSTTTMRRKLRQEGASFRALRADSIQCLATNLLSAGMQPKSVADNLGFSDVRSFSRAFKSWYNVTPAEYRNQHLG